MGSLQARGPRARGNGREPSVLFFCGFYSSRCDDVAVSARARALIARSVSAWAEAALDRAGGCTCARTGPGPAPPSAATRVATETATLLSLLRSRMLFCTLVADELPG